MERARGTPLAELISHAIAEDLRHADGFDDLASEKIICRAAEGLMAAGAFSEALPLAERAFEIIAAHHTPTSAQYGIHAFNLGCALAAVGRRADAKRHLEAALAAAIGDEGHAQAQGLLDTIRDDEAPADATVDD